MEPPSVVSRTTPDVDVGSDPTAAHSRAVAQETSMSCEEIPDPSVLADQLIPLLVEVIANAPPLLLSLPTAKHSDADGQLKPPKLNIPDGRVPVVQLSPPLVELSTTTPPLSPTATQLVVDAHAMRLKATVPLGTDPLSQL